MLIRRFEIVSWGLNVRHSRLTSRTSASQARSFTLLRLLGVIALVATLSALAAPTVFPAHP